MDPLNITSAVLVGIDRATRVAKEINEIVQGQEIRDMPGMTDQLKRLELQTMVFQPVAVDISKSLSEKVDSSLIWILDSIQSKLLDVKNILKSGSNFAPRKFQPPFQLRMKQKLEKWIDGLSEDMRLLCDLHHTFKLRDLREDFQKVMVLSQDAAKFSLDSSQVQLEGIRFDLDQITAALANVQDSTLKLLNNPAKEDETSKQRAEALEEVRQRLYERLGSLNQPSLVFPFNLVSQGSDTSVELPTRRVKLDTGAHDNWIQSSILERWGVQYDPMDDPKTYVGAGGGQFQAFGRVTLFWYSTNKAKTKESEFLVHDDLPFDAILGSSYIMAEPMDTFAEGVLPLIHIIPKDELGHLRDTMTARGIDSEGVKKIQRAQKAQEREENRQLKAASRAATRTDTPILATPTEGL